MEHKQYNTIALVVAAGSGQRAGTDIPKQYIQVKQKTIIDYTVQAFLKCQKIDAVLCVIAKDMHDLYEQSVTMHSKLLPVIFGGETRQESVKIGLSALQEYNPKKVLIHDVARPNIESCLIVSVIDALDDYDGVCPALPIADSLRTKDGLVVSRDGLFRVQTPQGFDFQKILFAHNACLTHDQSNFTDDIAIANAYGLKTSFVAGHYKNYKITYPQDLDRFMQEQQKNTIYPDIRTAMGYDVHRLITGDGVIMGGIKIECAYKLEGHSDADVVLHAITDALLGTIAAQDIGYHFSPHDARWKDADSASFLRYAHQLVCDKGGVINFIDTVIICEKPKINPHREAIQQNIAKILDLPLGRVSVKATTTEKLGFTGREEGIATQAVVTVIINK